MHKYIVVLIATLLASSSFAHNIVGGVYAVGTLIEGEVGFSDGEMGQAGAHVGITDAQGNKLGEVKVEEEGLFSFTATRRIDHHFSINLGSGHVLNTVLPADELPDSLAAQSATAESGTVVEATAAPYAPALSGAGGAELQHELQQMIERSVAKQVKPLRKELQAYKEKASLQDVLGGIGYIFGLCGIGIWLRQRKLDKQA